ncbi:hypothetical protein ACHAWF_015594 [Thalassiosira exigua]
MASMLDIGMFSYMMLELLRELEGDRSAAAAAGVRPDERGGAEVLSADDARLIPDIAYPGREEDRIDGSQRCCAVCTDDFEPGDVVVSLPPCRHVFHKKCILRWLTQYRSRCPLCMKIITVKA